MKVESPSPLEMKKIEGKMNKSRHFKNSKWVESAQSQPSCFCKGLGKKAWLRLLQVWAKADCRPGLHFLPNYHWQYIRRALLFKKKIIMRQPSTVEIKNISSILILQELNHTNVCSSFPSLWTGGAKPSWRGSVGQSGQHRQSLKIRVGVWSGSSSHCAIAWWCQWAGYYYTVYSSEGH